MASSSETNTTRGDGGKAYPSAGILAVTNAPPIYKSVDELTAYFGDFGGRFIPETLMEAHTQLEQVRVIAENVLSNWASSYGAMHRLTSYIYMRRNVINGIIVYWMFMCFPCWAESCVERPAASRRIP